MKSILLKVILVASIVYAALSGKNLTEDRLHCGGMLSHITI